MPHINLTIKHNLGSAEALKRIQSLLPKVKKQYAGKVKNLREEWEGNSGTFSFTAMGFDVSGSVTVKDTSVQITGTIPFLAGMFKGTIEQTLKEESRKLLS